MKCCLYCEEALLPGETQHNECHIECLARMTLGSVGHQRGTCPCRGGSEEDPPGLNKRDAARAAYAFGRAVHKQRKVAAFN